MCLIFAHRTMPTSTLSVEDSSSSSSISIGSPPRVRRIRFMENLDVSPSMAPLDAIETREQVDDIWYSARELDAIRTDFRTLYRELRSKNDDRRRHLRRNDDDDRTIISASFDSPTRELEQRSSLERQRRRILTIKFVLIKQHDLSADRLAQVVQRITRWAADLAVQEAQSDSGNGGNNENSDGESDERQAGQRTNKRSMEVGGGGFAEDRRVRPRLSLTAQLC